MARAPDERYNEALKLFRSGKKLIEIANQLNLPEGTVRRWKSTHKWDSERSDKKANVRKRKKGGQPGNKNAVGNEGGAAPLRNDNAVKHGLFEKYLPQETLDIVKNMSLNPLDILWDQIQIAYAAIIRAQQISYVKNCNDMTKEVSMDSMEATAYNIQYAWDKQANFMKAQARAQGELRSMIKQYDEMLHKNWDLATEEQKARIEVMKAKANIGGNEPTEDDGFIEALSGKVDEIWQEE